MSEAIANECREQCAYGTCRKTVSDPYGCGGCCSCLGGCQVAYEHTLPTTCGDGCPFLGCSQCDWRDPKETDA